jgi:hypothetical protein
MMEQKKIVGTTFYDPRWEELTMVSHWGDRKQPHVSTTWLSVPESTEPVIVSSQWVIEEMGVSNDKNEVL